MAKFIEATIDGKRVSINIDHIQWYQERIGTAKLVDVYINRQSLTIQLTFDELKTAIEQ